MPVSLKGITSTNDDPSRCVICSEPFVTGAYDASSALNVCCGKRACIDCSRKPGAFYVPDQGRCVLCRSSGARSIGLIKKKAKKGHAWAQEILGRFFFIGEAVKESDHEALRWFRKAAASGHPMAVVMVGHLLLEGDGCKMNISSARAHFERAISLDKNVAVMARELLVNVAVCYLDSRDLETAITILAPLAELGVNHARHNLGICYSNIGDSSKALDTFGRIASEEGLLEEPAAFEAIMKCCAVENMWPQARFWLSMGAKNLRSLLTGCAEPKKIIGLFVAVRADLRAIRDQCGGCGAALQGDMRKKCGGCKTFCYCNRDCQKAHWNRSKDGHREECKEVMELKRKVKDARKESKSENK